MRWRCSVAQRDIAVTIATIVNETVSSYYELRATANEFTVLIAFALLSSVHNVECVRQTGR